jgi:phosphate transport system permease protein
MAQQPGQHAGNLPDINQRNADWYIDKLVQYLVFLSGISAILLIVGIFVFVTIEGFGFILEDFSFREFFLSQWWEPTDDDEPTYGILALIAGTASVTGLAMLIAIPFSLAAPFTSPSSLPVRSVNF